MQDFKFHSSYQIWWKKVHDHRIVVDIDRIINMRTREGFMISKISSIDPAIKVLSTNSLAVMKGTWKSTSSYKWISYMRSKAANAHLPHFHSNHFNGNVHNWIVCYFIWSPQLRLSILKRQNKKVKDRTMDLAVVRTWWPSRPHPIFKIIENFLPVFCHRRFPVDRFEILPITGNDTHSPE